MIREVIEYLNELYPNATCELNYNKDYELLLAVVLSAQTTDKRVNIVTEILFKRYPTLELLKDADINDITDIIKPIGTFNKKAVYVKEIANILFYKYDSRVPRTFSELEKLPGVGHKTASVVLGNLYDFPTFAVDTHVSRVTKRLGLVDKDDDVLKIEEKMKKKLNKKLWTKTHHQLVLFGRYYCQAKKPICHSCKLINKCKYYKKIKLIK